MRLLSITLVTLALVFACAPTLARDDVARDVSANGPQHARGPAAVTSSRSQSGMARAHAEAAPRVTLNRSDSIRRGARAAGDSASAAARLPLGAPRTSLAAGRDRRGSWLDFKANKPVSTALTGLSIVLGAFLLLAWIARKRMPKGSARLPDEIIEVLGRTTIAAKQSLHLVRVGCKLIVVSVTATGTETLTEITDAGEVARILAACQQQHAHSSTAAFRQVFEEFGREKAHGFLDTTSDRSRKSTSQTRAA
jgi:flagellar biogenesis protein FliO